MTQNQINEMADMIAARIKCVSKEVLSLEEAAEYMGVSKGQMYKLTREREIPHSKPGGKMCYFRRADLDAWMLGNPVATQTALNTAAITYCMKKRL